MAFEGAADIVFRVDHGPASSDLDAFELRIVSTSARGFRVLGVFQLEMDLVDLIVASGDPPWPISSNRSQIDRPLSERLGATLNQPLRHWNLVPNRDVRATARLAHAIVNVLCLNSPAKLVPNCTSVHWG